MAYEEAQMFEGMNLFKRFVEEVQWEGSQHTHTYICIYIYIYMYFFFVYNVEAHLKANPQKHIIRQETRG